MTTTVTTLGLLEDAEGDPKVIPLPRRPVRREPLGTDGIAALGTWMLLAPIAMLFLAFVSAFIVRRGLGEGWTAVRLPALVWVNTAVLLTSSFTLELARRASRRGGKDAGWMGRTVLLGAMFLAGQTVAWKQLLGSGVSVGLTPYGSFFYLLTACHAVHLAGGLLALVAAALWPRDGRRKLSRHGAIQVSAIYWHFMTIVWVGILTLLMIGR
jgi:cytochrome c oxidase subunit 3